MGARQDPDVHLEGGWQAPQELHPDGQADEGGHAAMWDGGPEVHPDHHLLRVHLKENSERSPVQ